jgi:hypothetical protein
MLVEREAAKSTCSVSFRRFSLSNWPIPMRPIFVRGVFHMEEKPAPFTNTVKSAAPGNSIPKDVAAVSK